MYLSEAQAAVERAQAAVQEAKDALYWATLELSEAECDHPDTEGFLCCYCGAFYISPDQLEAQDDFNVLAADSADLRASGLPVLAQWDSPYAYGYDF